jgi:hypothetical protein
MRLLLKLGVGSWLCFGAPACSNKCELDDDLRLFAGDSARDCGLVEIGADRTQADDCVSNAFEAREPFIVRYSRQGTDSQVVTAVGANSAGAIKIFQWDSAPCGGPGCDPVTDVQSCDNPSLNLESSESPDALPIACGSFGNPQRVCG